MILVKQQSSHVSFPFVLTHALLIAFVTVAMMMTLPALS
jgi:hypothetical protein